MLNAGGVTWLTIKKCTPLCGAIDDVLDGLRTIPLAQPYARQLYSALLDAEDIYIDTTFYTADTQSQKVIQLKLNQFPSE